MTEDTWKRIPKQVGRSSKNKNIILRAIKTKKGLNLFLFISMYIRRKCNYFDRMTMHCNLFERGSFIKIQFISEEKADEDSRKVSFGSLSLSPLNFKSYLNEQRRKIEVPYKIDNGNIIIDRNTLKDAKELEVEGEGSQGNQGQIIDKQNQVLKKRIAKTLKRSAKVEIVPTKGTTKCHNCLEEIRLSKDGLDKDYRGARMADKWIFWHLPGQCPKDPGTHANLLHTEELNSGT